MINTKHTLNHVVNKNFDKEHFSGVRVHEFYETTLLNELLEYHNQFNTIAKPLVKFFDNRKIFPLHIITGACQNYSKFPTNFKPFEEIIHSLYKHIELFIEKFDYTELSLVNRDLTDMFLKTMFLEYIDYITCYNETVLHICNVRLIIQKFYQIVY